MNVVLRPRCAFRYCFRRQPTTITGLQTLHQAIRNPLPNPAYPGLLRRIAWQQVSRYREIFFKPYRIIYRVMGDNVYVLVIADGRRDMQALLLRRLLQA